MDPGERASALLSSGGVLCLLYTMCVLEGLFRWAV